MVIGPFRLGMRTMKSALAVMICILLFKIFDRGGPMIAALSAVFSLRQDLTSSLAFGKSRVIGNSIGGMLALLYFFVLKYFSNDFMVELFFLPFLVIIVIVLSDGIGNNPGIISAIATLLMIALSVPQGESVYYAFERVLDTFIGTFVAISINFLIRSKPIEKQRQIDEDLLELEKKEKELEKLRKKINKRIDEKKETE
ncbi:FUSC family protein [Enterococcus sp. BWB1-3]|uniref:FUSC family protein n=1 Tax=unclassified Enterococcus TaxID=2608891 RepID=UPI0019230AD3|nr:MULTISPECIES: aromatic acid exporter family protein [unclassified Enterococcus]MBL1230343.1 FUSC family protein [Enterococcus sp. BWB1-3]MCB5951039.1 aromatic acid exporter family protein [Enterococcus sp. BWT-B8]MCB5955131.1 aromatic acid exporter family protein [Enterococcus sp. CWB-B31]